VRTTTSTPSIQWPGAVTKVLLEPGPSEPHAAEITRRRCTRTTLFEVVRIVLLAADGTTASTSPWRPVRMSMWCHAGAGALPRQHHAESPRRVCRSLRVWRATDRRGAGHIRRSRTLGIAAVAAPNTDGPRQIRAARRATRSASKAVSDLSRRDRARTSASPSIWRATIVSIGVHDIAHRALIDDGLSCARSVRSESAVRRLPRAGARRVAAITGWLRTAAIRRSRTR
jgi:hypothetical protein